MGWFFHPNWGGPALYVYIVHTVVVYYVLLHVETFRNLDGVQLRFTLPGLPLVFWLMVKSRFLYQVIPRWMRSRGSGLESATRSEEGAWLEVGE